MGKRITAQRRGKGTSVYRAPSHLYVADVKYRKYDEKEKTGAIRGRVLDLLHAPERSAPLALVQFEDGSKSYVLACEGMKLGDEILCGVAAPVTQGNTLPLSHIPEGTPIYNIENFPGDGGRLVRSSGSYALVIAHDGANTIVQLPSGKLRPFDSRCRASVGILANGGRKDKPILKAGKAWHIYRSQAKYWPVVRKVKMNPVAHPHGGGSGHPGKPTTVARGTPPGRKVGLIAARRTGRR